MSSELVFNKVHHTLGERIDGKPSDGNDEDEPSRTKQERLRHQRDHKDAMQSTKGDKTPNQVEE